MAHDILPSKRNLPALIASFVIFSALFILLFIFRSIDDNRLTSWEWVFDGIDAVRVFLFTIPWIITAYILSGFLFRWRYGIFSLFFLSFLITVPFWQEPEVIVDASRYFTQAKHLELYGIGYYMREWGKSIDAWTDLPLIPFLYGLIFKFFGEHRIYIQIFTSTLFSMTLVLTFLIGKRLWDKEVGMHAAWLLLGIPYLFTQVPLMLVDVPTMFFLTLSIFAFIMALERGGVWIALSSIAIFLAALSKYSTWLMLSVLAVIFLVYLMQGRETGSNTICRGALVAIIACLLTGVVFLYKSEVFLAQIRLLLEYQKPGLRRWGESFVSTFLYQVHPFITVAALCSLYTAFRKRDLRYVIIAWLILLVIMLQIRRSRYILIVFPMLTLMASYGLERIRSGELRRFLISCIVASSVIIATLTYLPFLQKMSPVNLRDAGRLLDSIKGSYIEVFTLPTNGSAVNPAVSVPILDLFTGKYIRYHYEPAPSISFDKIKDSPLRFTWRYRNPEYYKGQDRAEAVVIITDRVDSPLPVHIRQRIGDYEERKVFNAFTGIFRYKTIVTVYQRSENF